jgi:hypothetical protein
VFETQGGGLYAHNSSVHIKNGLFHGNNAGLYPEFTIGFGEDSSKTGTVTTSTIVGNSTYMLYLATYSETPTIRNSIIRGPGRVLIGDFFRAANSNLSGGYPGPGNIDADPLFIDPANGDFRLQPNSPCIDAGTVVETQTDLEGNPRPVDVVGRGAEGAGAFDMGAYEFQLRPADLTRDGWVDSKDLIEFQKEWMRGEE